MKKQFLIKQVCSLSIMVAGALLPLGSVQAADELSDRYLNGYLNDPYSNEVAPDKKSVLPRGAEGPIRKDAGTREDRSMTHGQKRRESGSDAYSSPVEGSATQQRPMRDDADRSLYR